MNYARRSLGILICLTPVALLVGSLLSASRTAPIGHSLGSVLIGLGIATAGLNFYLSFIRGLVHRLRHGSLEGYRHVSGIPLIGTLFVVAGGIAGFGWRDTSIAGLAATALDTGGAPWFLISTWRDASFWDV